VNDSSCTYSMILFSITLGDHTDLKSIEKYCVMVYESH